MFVEKEIEIKQANKTLYITLVIIAIVIIGMFTNGFGLIKKNNSDTITINPSLLEIGNSPVLGNENSPITIYEFSDFSCPFCAAADGVDSEYTNMLKSRDPNWEAPIPNIINEYVKTGKAKIIFKYFPGHGSGKAAMIVGYALAEQNDDLFWKFHDLAFENQNDVGDLVKMKALAKTLGADMQKLDIDIQSGKYNPNLDADTSMGRNVKVSGTPSFIINDKLIEGAKSFSEFKKVLDEELSKQ